jgi:hypothetical protein
MHTSFTSTSTFLVCTYRHAQLRRVNIASACPYVPASMYLFTSAYACVPMHCTYALKPIHRTGTNAPTPIHLCICTWADAPVHMHLHLPIPVYLCHVAAIRLQKKWRRYNIEKFGQQRVDQACPDMDVESISLGAILETMSEVTTSTTTVTTTTTSRRLLLVTSSNDGTPATTPRVCIGCA